MPKRLKIVHADHGVKQQHIPFIQSILDTQELGFFVVCVKVPSHLPTLKSALYGPAAGDAPIGEDEVRYEKREKRPGPSRLIDKPSRECDRMVVIGRRSEEPNNNIIITAYGTQAKEPSPREWWDTSMTPLEAMESARFWSEHALATDE